MYSTWIWCRDKRILIVRCREGACYVVFEESNLGIAEMEQKEPEKRLVELEKPDPEEDDGDKEEEND